MNIQLKLLTKLFILLLCTGISMPALAQKSPQDDAFIQWTDVYVDYLKFGTFFMDSRTQWEAGVNVLTKYNISAGLEFGQAEWMPDEPYENTYFNTKGEYLRAGINYHIKTEPKNTLYFGLKYGVSWYDESANFFIQSELNDPYSREETFDNLRAGWAEIVVGTDQKIWKGLRAGAIFRYRILAKAPDFEPVDNFYIPGFGKKFNTSWPALNLVLIYRLGEKKPESTTKE